MQENHQEALDKMFPRGYLILYGCPDGQLRFAKWNPEHQEVIEDWHLTIVAMGKDKEQAFLTDPDRDSESWRG